MSKDKDVEIIEQTFSFFYRSLPVAAFIFSVMILDAYLSWPFAIGIAILLGFGVLGYWIPEKSKESFPRHVAFTILLSLVLSVIAHLIIWLGWIEDK